MNVSWHWQVEADDDIRKISVATRLGIAVLYGFLRTAWLSLEAFNLPQNCGTVTVRMRLGRSPTVIHFTVSCVATSTTCTMFASVLET